MNQTQTTVNHDEQPKPTQPAKQPGDAAGFVFSSVLTIRDPDTNETLLKMRTS